MNLVGKAKRVRIYVNENDLIGERPAAQVLLDFLRRENADGATVIRAMAGFSAEGEVNGSAVLEAAHRLPVIVEWVERPEVVQHLMPRIQEMVPRGLVTVDDTEVVHHLPFVRELSHTITAGDVMSRDVARVARDTPIREVVETMLGKMYRAVPVVEAGAPIGIITNSDLVTKGGLDVRMDLLKALHKPEVCEVLEGLAHSTRAAGDVMTPSPATVHVDTPLPDVAGVMSRRRLKRLPVIDDRGVLVGMVSRVDLLRTAAGSPAGAPLVPRPLGLASDTPVGRVMRRDVPLVRPEAPISEVFQAVVSTRLHRALVVDTEGRILGIVTDAELLDRITPSLRPGALRSLMRHLPFALPTDPAAAQHARARSASEIMSRHVATAHEDTHVSDAIALMLKGNHKIIAVTDAEGRLLGIVDRADLLHGLLPD